MKYDETAKKLTMTENEMELLKKLQNSDFDKLLFLDSLCSGNLDRFGIKLDI